MTRCEAFYRKVKQLVEAQNFEGLEAFCQKDSQVTLWRINNYIEFCDRYSLPIGNVAEGALRPLISEPNAEVQDKVVILLKEKLTVQKVAEKDIIALLNEAKGIPQHGIESEPSYEDSQNEIQTEDIPLITESPSKSVEKCSVCEVLPLDVQKQVEECVERAKLSKEEAEDLVKVVQETPKEELSIILMIPRTSIYQLHQKKPQPKLEAKEWKPKETWAQRQAVMKPQHSRIEEALLLKLQEKNIHPITDKEFSVMSTTPDFYFPDKNTAFYIDGNVHEGKEERDDFIRSLLTKRYGIRVVSIPYKDFTQEETERVFQQILGEWF